MEKLPELNISVLVSIILEQEKCRFFDDLYGKQIIDAFDKGGLISEDFMVLSSDPQKLWFRIPVLNLFLR